MNTETQTSIDEVADTETTETTTQFHLVGGVASQRTQTEPAEGEAYGTTTGQFIGTALEMPSGDVVLTAIPLTIDEDASASEYTPNRGCLKGLVALLESVPQERRAVTTITVMLDRIDARDQVLGDARGNFDLVRQVRRATSQFAKVSLRGGSTSTSPVTRLANDIALDLRDNGVDGSSVMAAADYEAFRAALKDERNAGKPVASEALWAATA